MIIMRHDSSPLTLNIHATCNLFVERASLLNFDFQFLSFCWSTDWWFWRLASDSSVPKPVCRYTAIFSLWFLVNIFSHHCVWSPYVLTSFKMKATFYSKQFERLFATGRYWVTEKAWLAWFCPLVRCCHLVAQWDLYLEFSVPVNFRSACDWVLPGLKIVPPNVACKAKFNMAPPPHWLWTLTNNFFFF